MRKSSLGRQEGEGVPGRSSGATCAKGRGGGDPERLGRRTYFGIAVISCGESVEQEVRKIGMGWIIKGLVYEAAEVGWLLWGMRTLEM